MRVWSDFAVRIETGSRFSLRPKVCSVKPASDMLHYTYFLFCGARAYLCIVHDLACRGHWALGSAQVTVHSLITQVSNCQEPGRLPDQFPKV